MIEMTPFRFKLRAVYRVILATNFNLVSYRPIKHTAIGRTGWNSKHFSFFEREMTS